MSVRMQMDLPNPGVFAGFDMGTLPIVLHHPEERFHTLQVIAAVPNHHVGTGALEVQPTLVES